MMVGWLQRRPDEGWLVGGGKVRLVKTDAKVVPGQTQRVSTQSRASKKVSLSVVFSVTTSFSNKYLCNFWIKRDGILDNLET